MPHEIMQDGDFHRRGDGRQVVQSEAQQLFQHSELHRESERPYQIEFQPAKTQPLHGSRSAR